MITLVVSARRFVAVLSMAISLVFISDIARLIASPPQRSHEVLVGDDARAHMEKKWSASPKRKAEHEAAIAWLKSRGYHPTNIYFTKVVNDNSTAVDRLTRRVATFFVPSAFAETF